MNIKFSSCFLDHSGYGQAARNMLRAMVSVGINVSAYMLAYNQTSVRQLDEGGALAKKLENRRIPYDIKLMMVTPDQAELQYEVGKYNICAMFWEVLGLDSRWARSMNQLDEIWTTSQVFADTFKHNGVYKPIKVIKPFIEIPNKNECRKLKLKRFIEGQDPEIGKLKEFLFYSIFQWTERKNPRALLKAYWEAFENNEDVALLLKVYKANFTESEREMIRDDINDWKSELGMKSYPKVFLVLGELSTKDIMRLHNTGDCFVSAHRGEGLGLPQLEAMSVGNPIISTNFGGIHEMLTDKEAWLIDYDLTQVFNMMHIPWYNSRHLWASADPEHLKESMLEAYSNRELTAKKGRSARAFVKRELNMEVVGKDILERLKLIDSKL